MNIGNKCVIYTRVSTDGQAKEGYSLEAQESTLREFAKKEGLEVVDIFVDAGMSGKSMKNRTAFNKMMKLILEDKTGIDTILVWKLSRFSRKILDTLEIFEKLNSYNKRLVSVSEQIDSLSPTGKMLVTMHSWIAEMERDNIIDNVRHGMKKKAENGLWNGRTPFGYELINKRLFINEFQAEIIKTIFDLYVNKNMGYKAIAIYLNERNIHTANNIKWDVATIREKLKNPIYIGYISWNKLQNYSTQRRRNKNDNPVYVKGQHEAIIDMQTWDKAVIRQKNSPGKFSRMYPGEFLISGILRCPDCGGPMVGYRRKNKKTGILYRYYQCNNARAKGTTACKHNMVSADLIEKEVLSKIALYVDNERLLRDTYNKINEKSSIDIKEIKNELKTIEISISKIDIKLKRLLELRLADEINNSEYTQYKFEFSENKSSLLEKKRIILSNLESPNTSSVSLETILEILKQFNTLFSKVSTDNQKRLLRILIEEISLNPGDKKEYRTIKKVKLRFIEPQLTSEAQIKNTFFPTTYGTVLLLLSCILYIFALRALL